MAIAAFIGLAYFYFAVPKKPTLERVTLCPVTGPEGITVVLVDTSDDLQNTTQRQLLGLLDDLITGLPPYHRLEIRVLDIPSARSQSLFAKCNPGDGVGLSEWTDNPRLARARWIEGFRQPAREAIKGSLTSQRANSSPIMAAIQDIAIDQFSSASVQSLPKRLIVISDMLEHTRDYSQYPTAGDLSFDRYRRSSAYAKFRTDLHGTRAEIEYVQRRVPKIDTVRHIEFWKDWFNDNRAVFERARRLQGAE